MNYDDLAQQIVKNVGGKENVTDCWHCVTRLRFTTKDKSKVNIDKIKSLKGVMGAQWSNEQFQVMKLSNSLCK